MQQHEATIEKPPRYRPGARSVLARTDTKRDMAPLKGACAVRGVPYHQARDAASRGELPVLRFSDRRQARIFVRWTALDSWLRTRTRSGPEAA